MQADMDETEILEEKETQQASYTICCDNLVKIYKTAEVEVMALQGLELTVEEGELVTIIGKSGSGKSTLLNMLGGLERPTAGRLYVGEQDLYAMTRQEMDDYRKYTVGFVWQNSKRNLFDYLTALENVEAPMLFAKRGEGTREKAKKLLELVGMSHKENAHPLEMSGGEQQRVAIAVALANSPKILLADEPTGAVDSKTSGMLQDLFHHLNKELGITVIIVTHDLSLANRSGRVVMISDGKISTEKIMKEQYQQGLLQSEGGTGFDWNSHDEYSVLDKANRLQLSEDILKLAGIDSNRVKVEVRDGRVVITKER